MPQNLVESEQRLDAIYGQSLEVQMKETNLADWNFNSNLETPLTAEAREIFDFYNDLKQS